MTQSLSFPCGARPARRFARQAWLLGLSLALAPASALAQGASAEPSPGDQAPEVTPEQDQPARAKVLVVVRLGSSGLDGARLLSALRRELPVELTTRGDVPNEGTLVLDLEASAGFVLGEYTASDGRKTARIVARPADAEAALDVIALLAGNLVRNEAKELLKELERSRAEEARKAVKPPPPPPPVAAAPLASDKIPAENKDPDVRADAGGSRALVAEDPMPVLRDGGVVHLSFFHPIALDGHSEDLSTDIELGLLYSRIGESRGLGFNLLVSRADARARGLQLAGLFAYAKRLEGVQLSQAAVVAGRTEGLQLSGGATLSLRALYGVQLAGAFSGAMTGAEGAQVAGAVSYVGDDMLGLQLAGAGSWTGGFLNGLQLSGVGNKASGVEGLQLGGVGNLNRGALNGVQISGVINLADQVRGLQIGALNVADDVDGIQVGVVNVADEVDGAAIGLVSLAKNGRVQPTLWVADGKRANAGVAFEVGPIYSLPFLGVDVPGDPRRYEWGFALGLKGRIDRVWGALDFGYSSEQEQLDGAITPLERGRVLAGVELLERTITVFGGVGVRSSELREATPESHFGVAFF